MTEPVTEREALASLVEAVSRPAPLDELRAALTQAQAVLARCPDNVDALPTPDRTTWPTEEDLTRALMAANDEGSTARSIALEILALFPAPEVVAERIVAEMVKIGLVGSRHDYAQATVSAIILRALRGEGRA